MATNFPTGLDSFTNPGTTSALNSPSHAGQHADINDAMEAVQAKIGVNTTTGTLFEWVDYTPSYNDFTVGNATVISQYCRINEIVFWRFELEVGSTTAFHASSAPRISYPIAAEETWLAATGGNLFCEDTSGTDYYGALYRYSGTEVRLGYFNVSSNKIKFDSIDATAPFTWTTGDRLMFTDWYRPA